MKHGFSKIVHFSDLRSRTKRFKFNLDEQQQKSVAKYLDLIEVKQLDAFMELNGNEKKRQISLTGHLNVEARQRCVVSGVPVPVTLKLELNRRFTENPKDAEWVTEEEDTNDDGDDDATNYTNAGMFADDPPDLVEHDEIDLGFIMVEELSLNLDPFPKSEGCALMSYSTDKNSENIVHSTDPDFNPETAADNKNPFTILKTLSIQNNSDKKKS